MPVTKPTCKLVGTDGNAFSIIGKVSQCLKKAGLKNAAEEFSKRAFSAGSYDNLLQIVMEYVDVE